ncbi:SRPBCC family protein [Candidatus Poribacteria bacterium]|jgi:hypothetical protein|nr:SRPBCC family protein [Candidatus Poribacteria bacterium]MBT5710525.1 SRPBCC family protein [Candidatus Poribacteria bacterium]MBT7101311.1 SRPBCC family protein [Candidatus Poribacteria bacterium]MBT7805257.1 SRPBCC family protein [Candidatus Poribacteria bacterium]
MAKVAVTHKFDAAAEDVWALVGGFHTLPNWHPAAVRSTDQSDGNDIVRDLELPDGGHVIERLEEFSNAARSYTYSIIGGVMPVAGYVATLSVFEDDNGASAVAHWTAEFDVVGADEQETVDLVANDVFRTGLAAAAEKV